MHVIEKEESKENKFDLSQNWICHHLVFFHFGLGANFGVIFDHFEFCPHDFHPL